MNTNFQENLALIIWYQLGNQGGIQWVDEERKYGWICMKEICFKNKMNGST